MRGKLPGHIRRVSFTTRLHPEISSWLNMKKKQDPRKTKSFLIEKALVEFIDRENNGCAL